ncbi:MAG TPA: peptidylprolyl isomerase [Chitinophagales bacterium]|nr:peptidylprolyl isomerase [Chitinophagales bacterium]
MKKLLLLMLPLLLVSFKAKEKRSTIEITTDYGVMKIMLYNETPLHRDNMLAKVRAHFFDSLLFHRVIASFMIQGGDPESKHAAAGAMLGNGSAPGDRIPAEFNPNLFHKKGVLAMARDNNPQKASSNCQFYIVEGTKATDQDLDNQEKQTGVKYTTEQREIYKTVGGTWRLDQNYTVFGEVYEGMNVIDSIAHVPKDKYDRPLKDVRMYVKEGKKIDVK